MEIAMKALKVSLVAASVAGMFAASEAGAWAEVTPTAFSSGSPSAVLSVRTTSFSDPAFGYQAWAHQGRWATLNAERGKTYTIRVSPSSVDASGNPVTPVVGMHPAVAVWKRPIGTVAQPYVYYTGARTPANRVEVTNLTDAKYVPDHFFFPAQSYIEGGQSQNHNQATSGGSCTDSATKTCATMTKTIGGTSVTAKVAEFWSQARRASSPTTSTSLLLEDGTTDIGFARMLFIANGYDNDGAPKMWDTLNVNPALRPKTGDGSGTVAVSFTADESVQYEFFVGAMNPNTGLTAAFYPHNVTVSGW